MWGSGEVEIGGHEVLLFSRWVCVAPGTTDQMCPTSTSTRPSASPTEEGGRAWAPSECEWGLRPGYVRPDAQAHDTKPPSPSLHHQPLSPITTSPSTPHQATNTKPPPPTTPHQAHNTKPPPPSLHHQPPITNNTSPVPMTKHMPPSTTGLKMQKEMIIKT